MQIQLVTDKSNTMLVVICFKFSNFAYANTVSATTLLYQRLLLFALNLVTLLMQIQWQAHGEEKQNRCYLL